jgi:hypothetical protein
MPEFGALSMRIVLGRALLSLLHAVEVKQGDKNEP